MKKLIIILAFMPLFAKSQPNKKDSPLFKAGNYLQSYNNNRMIGLGLLGVGGIISGANMSAGESKGAIFGMGVGFIGLVFINIIAPDKIRKAGVEFKNASVCIDL